LRADAATPDLGVSGDGETSHKDALQSADGSAADAGEDQPPTLVGRWALIGFEDPIRVSFITDGDAVFGVICWSYRDCEEGANVTGSRKELNVAFETRARYQFTFVGTLAADGSRIGGTFKTSTFTRTVAWLQLPSGKEWLDQERSLFLTNEPIWIDLKLMQRPAGSTEFDDDKTYRLLFSPFGIFGDLGAFWHTERTPNAPLTIQHPDGRLLDAITLGPVAATRPDLPIKLVVGTTDDKVQAVWLTLPGGREFLFGR